MTPCRVPAVPLSVLLVAACAPPAADFAPDQGWTAPAGVSIDRVDLLQGPEHRVQDAGEPVLSDVPLVAERATLVRVHVTIDDTYDGHPVTARLDLGGEVLEQELALVSSSKGRLDSTVNFELSPDRVPEEALELAVELAQWRTADTEPLRWPASGLHAEPVALPRTVLRVHLVPFAYWGDGSGRLPHLPAEQLEGIRDTLLSRLPVSDVELTVGEVVDYHEPVSLAFPWLDVANATLDVRTADDPDDEVVYYGLMKPVEGGSWCDHPSQWSQCISGVALSIPEPGEVGLRVAAGAGFEEAYSGQTVLHEVGHLLGRQHVDCGGAAGVDPDYPHQDGQIGVEGWDLTSGRLQPARQHADFMSYCLPQFVSDYTWDGLAAQLLATASDRRGHPEALELERVTVDHGGRVRVWSPVRVHEPGGEPVDVWNAEGWEAEGRWLRGSDGEGGTVLLPRPPTGRATVELPTGPVEVTL